MIVRDFLFSFAFLLLYGQNSRCDNAARPKACSERREKLEQARHWRLARRYLIFTRNGQKQLLKRRRRQNRTGGCVCLRAMLDL